MLISINVESAVRAYVILLKPGFEAVDMKVMFAPQEEHFVALDICLEADSAHPVGVLLDHSLDRDLLEYLLPHSELLLDLLVHVLVVELLEGVDVHALNRGKVVVVGGGIYSPILVLVVVFEDTLPFVVPDNEVQVVLARWVHLNWLVFLKGILENAELLCKSVFWRGQVEG
jgi:hypothetical protein